MNVYMKKSFFVLFLSFIFTFFSTGCDMFSNSYDSFEPDNSSEMMISSFILQKSNNPNMLNDITGKISGKSITLEVFEKTDVSYVIPTITYTGASISPDNEIVQDFSNGPVIYTVTAEDGSTTDYTVSITFKSVEALITNIEIPGQIDISIDQNSEPKIIYLIVQQSTNLIDVIPTRFEASAGTSIEFDGAPFTSGVTPITIQEPSGSYFTVYSENPADSPNYYYLGITRYSNAAEITQFDIGPFTGSIDQGAKTINVTVPGAVDLTSVTPTISIPADASLYLDSNPYNQGDAMNITDGVPFTLSVQSQDNSASIDYTVTVTQSSNAAEVSAFSISGAVGTPAVDQVGETITLNIEQSTSLSGVIPAITYSPGATFNFNSSPYSVGTAMSLTEGSGNTLEIISEDGSVTKTYTITVTRFSDLGEVTAFTIPGAVSAPVIDQVGETITLNIQQTASLTSIMPSISFSTDSTLEFNSVPFNYGVDSVTLSEGTGDTLTVISQDGTVTKTYTLTITRYSNDAEITAFTIPNAVGIPVIDQVGETITLNIEQAATLVSVMPTMTYSADATLNFNSTPFIYGSDTMTLSEGTGDTLAVTSQDGTVTKTYIFAVTRYSDDATFTDFQMNSSIQVGSATVTTSPNTVTINIKNATDLGVTHAIDSIAKAGTATIEYNSTPVITSDSINLNEGSVDTITIKSQDLTVTNVYTVTVNRLSDAAQITQFDIPDTSNHIGQIDEPGKKIKVKTPVGFSLIGISPIMTISPGATLTVPGLPVDFTSGTPQTFQVVSEDGTNVVDYDVIVYNGPPIPVIGASLPDTNVNISPDGSDVFLLNPGDLNATANDFEQHRSLDIAINTFGDIIIGWIQDKSGTDQVYLAHMRNNGPAEWIKAPIKISDTISACTTSAVDIDVDISDNASRNAIVVWNCDNRVFRLEYNGSWELSPTEVSSTPTAHSPRVALSNSGSKVIVWVESDSMKYMLNNSNTSFSWAAAGSLFSGSPGQVNKPAVAINDSGKIAVAFICNPNVWGSYYIETGDTWETTTGTIMSSANSPSPPRLKINNAGIAAVTFSAMDGGFRKIYKTYYDTVGTSWAATTSSTPFISAAVDVIRPYIDIDDSNNTVITYLENGNVQSCSIAFNDTLSGNCSPSDMLNSAGDMADAAQVSRVALDVSGNGKVVWQQINAITPYPDSIFMADFTSGLWTLPTTFASDRLNPDGLQAVNPKIALSSDGAFYAVVWIQQDMAGFYQVFLRRY